MNVLLVDDGGGKYSELLGIIDSVLPGLVKIDHAGSKMDALLLLRRAYYPLVLIDLFLPLRKSESPNPQGGLELIESIELNGIIRKPWFIFAVSRCLEDCSSDVRPTLEAKGIPLVDCSEEDVKNYDSVVECLHSLVYLERVHALVATDFRVDYLLIATLDAEFSAVVDSISDLSSCEIPLGCKRAKSGKILLSSGAEIDVVVIQLLGAGPVCSAVGTANTCALFSPRAVVLVGICGGVKGESDLGDLICASEVVDYTKGKIVDSDGVSVFEPESNSISTALSGSNHGLLADEGGAILLKVERDIKAERPTKLPRVISGHVASGNQVLGRSETIRELKENRYRKLKGIEMEAWGSICACGSLKNLAPKFFMFKSVSDLSDENKGDKYHSYCSLLSAGFVIEAIKAELL